MKVKYTRAKKFIENSKHKVLKSVLYTTTWYNGQEIKGILQVRRENH